MGESVTIVILVTMFANEVGRDTQGDQTCQIRWQDPMCPIVVWTCQLSWAVHHGGDQTFKTRTYWQYVQHKKSRVSKLEAKKSSVKKRKAEQLERPDSQSAGSLLSFCLQPTSNLTLETTFKETDLQLDQTTFKATVMLNCNYDENITHDCRLHWVSKFQSQD